MARQTPFTEDDRTLLRCIKADYDYISEQFPQMKAQLQRMESYIEQCLQMKAQLQRMESYIQRQEEELADLRRRGLPHVEKILGDCWVLKRELATLRTEMDSLRREQASQRGVLKFLKEEQISLHRELDTRRWEQSARPATAEREEQEESQASPTLEAPDRVQ